MTTRVTAKKHGGDDAGSWTVFVDGREFVNGLTYSEVPYYKRAAAEILKRVEVLTGKEEASHG